MSGKALFFNIKTAFYGAILVGGFFIFALTIINKPAYASCVLGFGCCGCIIGDVPSATQVIEQYHEQGETQITDHIDDEFEAHEEWLITTFFEENVLKALMLFAEQMSAVAMQQVLIIGTFLDAKHQLETQQLFQQLQVQAHKDYHPSQDLCWIGTNTRSMANSEAWGRNSAVAMGNRSLSRHLGNANVNAARNRDEDKEGRWRQFTSVYCDPKDNNWQSNSAGTGLVLACGAAGGADNNRRNSDIDYTRMIDKPHTISVSWNIGREGEDVMALANNLYGHDVLSRKATKAILATDQAQHVYLALRSVAAKRSVAENSFNAIVGLKSWGSDGHVEIVPPTDTRKYMGAVFKELGIPEAEIDTIMGKRPSYYLQLEVLAKKIYQNPDWFAHLYDKPANVARKKVALQGIELMLDRAIYESQLRQEMVMSVLLSSKIRKDFKAVSGDLGNMTNTGN